MNKLARYLSRAFDFRSLIPERKVVIRSRCRARVNNEISYYYWKRVVLLTRSHGDDLFVLLTPDSCCEQHKRVAYTNQLVQDRFNPLQARQELLVKDVGRVSSNFQDENSTELILYCFDVENHKEVLVIFQ